MGFLRPKTPSAAPAPPPPVPEDADAKAQEYQDRLRQRRGRASSILTGPKERLNQSTASKTLLGQ